MLKDYANSGKSVVPEVNSRGSPPTLFPNISTEKMPHTHPEYQEIRNQKRHIQYVFPIFQSVNCRSCGGESFFLFTVLNLKLGHGNPCGALLLGKIDMKKLDVPITCLGCYTTFKTSQEHQTYFKISPQKIHPNVSSEITPKILSK